MHKLKRFTATIIVLALVIISFFNYIETGATSTSQELEAALDRQDAIAMQMSELESRQDQLASSRNNLSGELAWLNERSEEQKKLYEERTIQLQAALSEMDKSIAEYAEASEVLEQKKQQYNQRMQIMYEHKNKSIFTLFIESDSLHGFFTTMQLMSIIADTDEQMLDDLEIAKDNAELKKQVAQQQMQDMEVIVEQIEGELAQIEADANVSAQNLAKIESDILQQQQAEEELNALSEQIGSEIFALQQQLAAERAAAATKAAEATRAAEAERAAEATRAAEAARAAAEAEQAAATDSDQEVDDPEPEQPAGNVPNSSGWVWPVPSSRSITSYYGNRMHPVLGYMRFHSGVDIGAGFGEPIVAARAGTVIIVRNPVEGQNWGGYGYGNYVVVDHGDGYATLYAHLKNTRVSVGQTVAAGELVGTCGSTGTSTGSHLHFEVMINGSTTNPLNYIG